MYLFSSPLSDSRFLVDFLGKDYEKNNLFFFPDFPSISVFLMHFGFVLISPPKNSVEIFFSLTLAGFLDFGGLGLGS